MPKCTARGCRQLATWEIEIRRAGAEYWIYYACEEQARRMQGIPLQCHKCGHTWMYCGGSQYRTTCPACHITVYLDKCRITRDRDREAGE